MVFIADESYFKSTCYYLNIVQTTDAVKDQLQKLFAQSGGLRGE